MRGAPACLISLLLLACESGSTEAEDCAHTRCDAVAPPIDGAADASAVDAASPDSGPGCEETGAPCPLQLGVCQGAEVTCAAGEARCTYGATYEVAETACDGLDNDCDGRVDPDCPCVEASERACGSEVGACEVGVQRCVGERWGPCEGGAHPAEETCDGRDEDCDGLVDEALGPVPCPLAEGVCAGVQGACAGGARDCEGAYGVGYELVELRCDGLDNDCDGVMDEGCACAPGAQRPCGSAIGACREGQQTCGEEGVWGGCVDVVGARPERCDGADEDCDGLVDEGLDAPACALVVGVCRGARQRCEGGAWDACGPEVYAAHDPRYVPQEGADHCDALDNDCDGAIDEACACADGARQVCGDNVGRCTQGIQRCAGGRWGPCDGVGPAGGEACDGGADEDCDGRTDEGCGCVDGVERPCGPCAAGRERCVDGAWGACEGVAVPAAEVCNGLDDDCDGAGDEDAPCDAANAAGRCAGGACRLECHPRWFDGDRDPATGCERGCEDAPDGNRIAEDGSGVAVGVSDAGEVAVLRLADPRALTWVLHHADRARPLGRVRGLRWPRVARASGRWVVVGVLGEPGPVAVVEVSDDGQVTLREAPTVAASPPGVAVRRGAEFDRVAVVVAATPSRAGAPDELGARRLHLFEYEPGQRIGEARLLGERADWSIGPAGGAAVLVSGEGWQVVGVSGAGEPVLRVLDVAADEVRERFAHRLEAGPTGPLEVGRRPGLLEVAFEVGDDGVWHGAVVDGVVRHTGVLAGRQPALVDSGAGLLLFHRSGPGVAVAPLAADGRALGTVARYERASRIAAGAGGGGHWLAWVDAGTWLARQDCR